MGLFKRVKSNISNIVNIAKEQTKDVVERNGDEANRFNPKGKSLEWFCSEDGIKTFKEYITSKNYFLEEKIRKKQETVYSDYELETVINVLYKEEKLPYTYFKEFVDKIDVQALQFVGTTELLVTALSLQARPFYIDDDGDVQPITPNFTPEEIVSVEKNPILNFVKNFNCFELADDAVGSWQDKWELWSKMLIFLGSHSWEKDILYKNPWIFSKEVYLDDSGSVRNLKEFCKKCLELATDEVYKEYFEKVYNECE